MPRAGDVTEQGMLFDMPAPGEYIVPTGATPEPCRSCGASVIWGHTNHGNPVPLNADHIRTIGTVRYAMTHFATCPQARGWRKQ
jgi:hypothetical protein